MSSSIMSTLFMIIYLKVHYNGQAFKSTTIMSTLYISFPWTAHYTQLTSIKKQELDLVSSSTRKIYSTINRTTVVIR